MSFRLPLVSCSTIVGLLSIGCATTSEGSDGSKGARGRGEAMQIRQPFPSRERIAEIAEASVQQPLAVVGTMAAVTSWSIEPAVPNADWRAPYVGDDPNATAFAAWVKASVPKATASASMTCLAQQYARFNAEHAGSVAGADVLAFMHTRCGVPERAVVSYGWAFPASSFQALDPNRPQSKVIDVLADATDETLTGLGVWKTEDKVFISVLVANPSIRLKPLPFASGHEGSVQLAGIYAPPSEWMQAMISHGTLGAKDCERIPVAGAQGSSARPTRRIPPRSSRSSPRPRARCSGTSWRVR